MIWNGFDPGVLALLAGEDRVPVENDATEGKRAEPEVSGMLLGIVAAGICLASAILLAGMLA